MSNKQKSEDKKTYNLASAVSRIFCRLFDLILIFLILVGLFFAIFNIKIANIYDIESYRIFIFTVIIFILFFCYFILVPFFFNGYTLFAKLFKIKIHSTLLQIAKEKTPLKPQENSVNNKKLNLNFSFLKQLLIRESLTLFIMTTITLILGIISLFSYEAKTKVLDFLINLVGYSNTSNTTSSENIIGTVFQTAYAIGGLIDLVIIINIGYMNNKRAFIDNISNTVVVKMVETYVDDKNSWLNLKNKKKTKVKYNLPGEIDSLDVFKKDDN